MATYQIETENGVYEIETEGAQPMFKTEAEGRAAIQKAQGEQTKLEVAAKEAGNIPKQVVSQLIGGSNRAINTATMNIPENLMNKAGFTGYAANEDPFIKSAGEASGFLTPSGAPMRLIKGAEIVSNPLTRNVVQGAAAMATQLPTAERGIEEYATGIGMGAAGGVAGRGIEKVSEGAIQAGAKATSGRIHDYLLKLPVGSFKFGKNPVKVASDEGIVAGNMAEYEQLADQRIKERSAQLEGAIANSDKTVNISEMVDKHLNSAASKLSGSLKDRTAKIDELNTVKANLEAQYGDLTQLKVQDAIKLKRQLADDFPFTQEGAGDITTKSAHKIYHDINKYVEEAHPEIADLNERVSGLIDIKNAARNRSAVEMRNNPLGLVARGGAMAAGVGGVLSGHSAEGILSAIGIMGVEKAIQSPAVLTRVAKALSAMSMDDRLKVLEAYPKLKTVIKVDARDVEIITPEAKSTPIARRVNRPKAEFVEQRQIGFEGAEALPAPTTRLGLPNLPPSGYKTARDPNAIRLGDSGATSTPIPMGKRARTIEQGASQTTVRPLVEEQGETIIQLPKNPEVKGSGKTKTPIKSKALASGAAAVAIPSVAEAAQDIDMDKIYDIESSNNPKAFNKGSNARGLGQVTPIVLKEWNNLHPKDKHSGNDLFNANVNKKISNWYMNRRIPQLLKSFNKKDTIQNRLIAYNAGIGKVGKILPKETADYIKKFNRKKEM